MDKFINPIIASRGLGGGSDVGVLQGLNDGRDGREGGTVEVSGWMTGTGPIQKKALVA
jgi:hypothetical protein